MQFNGIVIYLSSSDQRNLQNGLIADARFFSKIVSRNHDRFHQSNSLKCPFYLENLENYLGKLNLINICQNVTFLNVFSFGDCIRQYK